MPISLVWSPTTLMQCLLVESIANRKLLIQGWIEHNIAATLQSSTAIGNHKTLLCRLHIWVCLTSCLLKLCLTEYIRIRLTCCWWILVLTCGIGEGNILTAILSLSCWFWLCDINWCILYAVFIKITLLKDYLWLRHYDSAWQRNFHVLQKELFMFLQTLFECTFCWCNQFTEFECRLLTLLE